MLRYGVFLVALLLQNCDGSPTNAEAQNRYMDMGNGILTPDVNDLMHEAAAVSNAMMTNSIAPVGQPAYSYSGSMMPQMYPSPGYVGSFVDNSILTHFSTIMHLISFSIRLLVNSFGIIPASFNIGDSPPIYIKLMALKNESYYLQELYYRLLSIIAADLTGLDRILSFLPGFLSLKKLIGIPVFIIQKIIQVIQDLFSLFGY